MDNNDQLVKFRTLNWKEICQKAFGKDWAKPEPGYEFSGNRKFDTPADGGPYAEEQE